MRLLAAMIPLLMVACAGEAPAPTTLTTRYVTPASQGGAPVTPVTDASGHVTGDTLAEAKRSGYTLVNEDGKELLCRTVLKTGSRLQKDTYCLTEAEYVELRERTQAGIQNSRLNMPPPQGR